MYTRRLGATSSTIEVQPFDRLHSLATFDAQGRPPHAIATDGSWVSLVHGVNADGSFQSGRDPLTGEYWPGDAWIGLRPVYYLDRGAVPFMDPDGFADTYAAFVNGFGGAPGTGTIYVAPPTPGTPQTVTKEPPPLQLVPPSQLSPAQAANTSAPAVAQSSSTTAGNTSLSSSFTLSPKVVIAALVLFALFTRR